MYNKINDLVNYLHELGFNLTVVTANGYRYRGDLLLTSHVKLEELADYVLLLAYKGTEEEDHTEGAIFLCPNEDNPVQGFSESMIPVMDQFYLL